MKKTYGKPMITFESFALSGNIAASCSGLITGSNVDAASHCTHYGTHSDPDLNRACVYYDGNYTIFYGDNCMMHPQDGVFGNLCYQTSSEESRMFAS